MKKILSTIGALGLILVMPLSALAESAVPTIPVIVYGDVTINGVAAPVGTTIKAKEAEGEEIDSFTIKNAGKYYMNISEEDIPVGEIIVFYVNGAKVTTDADTFKMVSVAATSIVEYDLAATTSSSNGNGGGGGGSNGGSNPPVTPATPATPANPGTTPTTPAIPAIPASPASDANGQVRGDTDSNILDGDIIQCKTSANPNAVYIVKIVNGKKYIRHIVSLQIFNHYKHLKWENLIQVQSLDGFSLSGWVRVNTGANGTPGANDRVFEINGDQTRHWIDMTAAEFLLHGGSDEGIYSINIGELNLYKEGPAVKLK